MTKKSAEDMAREPRYGAGRSVERPNRADDLKELLASVVESSQDAIITKTSEGIITYWNHGAEMIYGYSASEVVGKPISMLLPPDGVDEVPTTIERVLKGDMPPHYETTHRRKDGRTIHVSMSISPIKKDGDVVGATTIARDVTMEVEERRRNEERLAAASQYARSLIESSLDPLVTISVDGKITDVNEATIKVTGVSREQLIGTDFSNYFTEPDKAREGYQQVFAKGFVTDYPLTIRSKGGNLTNVVYNASVYKDARGNVMGVFAAARDVTARRRAEQELAEQRQRELERLTELEKFQRLVVGRELKMMELKRQIEELNEEITLLKQRVA